MPQPSRQELNAKLAEIHHHEGIVSELERQVVNLLAGQRRVSIALDTLPWWRFLTLLDMKGEYQEYVTEIRRVMARIEESDATVLATRQELDRAVHRHLSEIDSEYAAMRNTKDRASAIVEAIGTAIDALKACADSDLDARLDRTRQTEAIWRWIPKQVVEPMRLLAASRRQDADEMAQRAESVSSNIGSANWPDFISALRRASGKCLAVTSETEEAMRQKRFQLKNEIEAEIETTPPVKDDNPT